MAFIALILPSIMFEFSSEGCGLSGVIAVTGVNDRYGGLHETASATLCHVPFTWAIFRVLPFVWVSPLAKF